MSAKVEEFISRAHHEDVRHIVESTYESFKDDPRCMIHETGTGYMALRALDGVCLIMHAMGDWEGELEPIMNEFANAHNCTVVRFITRKDGLVRLMLKRGWDLVGTLMQKEL